MTLSDGLAAIALPIAVTAALLSACSSDAPTVATTGATTPAAVVAVSTTIDTEPMTPVPAPPVPAALAPTSPAARPVLERVLTVGDGVMFDLEPALAASLAPYDLRPRSYLGSGLSNPEHFDWQSQWRRDLGAEPVQLVIVLLGVWDARTVNVDGVDLTPGSAEWTTWYRSLVTSAATTLASDGAEVLWIAPLTEPDPAKASRLAAVEAVITDVVSTMDGQAVLDGDAVLAGTANHFASHDSRGDALRKSDGEHLCPAGATALADAVRIAASRWFAVPNTGDWQSGSWRTDPRYTRADEGCAS